jgi:hypothetical protein
MKKLLFILLLIPVLVFSQDSKNREMQMQVNNLQPPPPPPPPGPRGSVVKTNAFLTSSDFVFLQKPTYESGWLKALSAGWGKSSANGVYSYGGNGFVTTDGSQLGISGFISKGSNNLFLSYVELAKSRTTTITYAKLYKGKWNKGFGLNLSSSFIKVTESDSVPPMHIVAPSLMFFINRSFNTGKFVITPDLLFSYSNPYFDMGKNSVTFLGAYRWVGFEFDPTFNALIGTSLGYKISKRFILLVAYKGNINTNPKFGLMSNISIGNKFNF